MLVNSGQASRLPATIGGGFGSALPAPTWPPCNSWPAISAVNCSGCNRGTTLCPLPMSQTTGVHQAMDLGPWLLLPLLPLALLARIGTLWLVLVGRCC